MSTAELLLIVLLVLLLAGGGWGYSSRQWGPGPLGGVGFIVLIIVLVLLIPRLARAAAPTVSELNAERSDGLAGLGSFLLSIPSSHEAAIFYASLLAMIIGFIASWVVKYALVRKIEDSLVSYFFKSHSRNTLGTVCTYLSTVLGAITTGVFDNEGTFTGWYNVFAFCISAAMGADGTINKGTKPEWTPEQRAAERDKIAAEAAAK